MNAIRIPFALAIAALCFISAPYAAVSEAASAPAAVKQAPVAKQAAIEDDDEGTSVFHEIIFERELVGTFVASAHKFVVTPKTVFLDRHGAKITLSSIRGGSILRVWYRQEGDNDSMVAVKVMVRQGPGE